jgi:RNA polymerase sigma-70 factor (ECF subfamily)
MCHNGGAVLTALVDRARHGDREAFGALAQAAGDRCIAIAFRILRDVSLAEDATQAAFVAAWRELGGLRDPDRFEPWLHQILVRCCYAEARRRRRATSSLLTVVREDSYAPDEILTVHDRDQLERGFRRLPPEQRAVLVFHHYLGYSHAEVADHLGIPLGTVKSRLRYGTSALRAALDADAREPATSKERPA